MKKYLLFVCCLAVYILHAEDGYRLWLRYDKVDDNKLLEQYRNEILFIRFTRSSPTLDAAKEELLNGLQGLLDEKILLQNRIENGSVLVGTTADSIIHSLISTGVLNKIG